MKYGSVCSGIEAATVAWHPLGWKPSFFSEIDPNPRTVLAHHYPDVPLHGDFTTIQNGDYDPIDLLVGGTPCQSFSVAGLRGGLADERGNLALEYLLLAKRLRPRWLVWENVPGVLSSEGGRDFGSILGGLVELGYGFAYRVLDAQFVRIDGFGRAVPQRRRRVFVVGYLGDWRRAAAVLFERQSLRGDTPPRRQSGEGTTYDAAPCLTSSGRGVERTGETRGQDPLVAMPILAGGHSNNPLDENLVAHALRAEGFDASEDGTGRGTPLVPIAFDTTQITSKTNRSSPQAGGPCHTLAKGANPPAIAFSCKDYGNDAMDGLSPTLRAMGHAGSHANAGGQLAVAIQDARGLDKAQNGRGWNDDGTAYTVDTASQQAVATAWAVRRLLPVECEKLQGFPPNYTLVPTKRGMMADGPRYKMLGNSMAVNVMRWIGRRIEMVEAINATRNLEAAE